MSCRAAILFSILLLLVIFLVISGMKAKQLGYMEDNEASFSQSPKTVSISLVALKTWPNHLLVVGSLEVWQGLTMAAEADGRVAKINFESGQLLIKQE